MLQLTEEELLKYLKSSKTELNTLAEIHKILFENKMKCSVEEVDHTFVP